MLKLIVVLVSLACVCASPVSRYRKKGEELPSIPSVVAQLLELYKHALSQRIAAPPAPVRYLVASTPTYITRQTPQALTPRYPAQWNRLYSSPVQTTKCPCSKMNLPSNYRQNIPSNPWQTPSNPQYNYQQYYPHTSSRKTLCQVTPSKGLPPALQEDLSKSQYIPVQTYHNCQTYQQNGQTYQQNGQTYQQNGQTYQQNYQPNQGWSQQNPQVVQAPSQVVQAPSQVVQTPPQVVQVPSQVEQAKPEQEETVKEVQSAPASVFQQTTGTPK